MGEYLSTPSGLIHWKDYGGHGDPVLLVHGLGGSVYNWDAVGPRLTVLGRIVALDLPGFGLSPPWRDWELSTHVSAIVALMDELGEQMRIVGNSMGGLLAEMIAAEHPERVEALILVSPATPPRLPDPRVHWPTARRLLLQATPIVGPALARRVISTHSPERLVSLTLSMVTHKPGRVPMELVETFIELARIRKQLPWAAEAVPSTGNSIARFLGRRARFVEMIRRIPTPTLVVQGTEDQIVSPTSVEWLCSLRADWDLVTMPDTGHTPQIDSPIRFVDTVSTWMTGLHEREFSA